MSVKLVLILICTALAAQQPDSLQTTSADTVKRQSFTPTQYTSDYSVTRRNAEGETITRYIGKAKIIYQDMKIEAHQIDMNFASNTLVATPKLDTLPDGSVKVTGLPVFTQVGQEPMHGFTMEYNFQTRRGRIKDGNTTVETAKYVGEQIKKIGSRTFLIKDGKFTTCLADTPSYWIHADRIRMIQDDKVFTGPLLLYIWELPFPVPLPFGVFSLERGRRSGVVIPAYYSGSRGRGFEGLGYFWAASEFVDAELLMNYYDRTSYVLRTNILFRDRYNYSGNFSAHYSPINVSSGATGEQFGFRFGYAQTIDPSLRINGSGNFESSITNTRQYRNFENQANQRMSSILSMSKTWDGSSMTATVRHFRNLLTLQESYTFPSMNYTLSTMPLITPDDPLNPSWYEKINFSYSSSLTNEWSNSTVQNDEGEYVITGDVRRQGVNHRISMSAPFKIFKYINFSPRVNYQERWVTRVNAVDERSTDSLIVTEKDEFAALRTFSLGFGASTNLFGLFEPNIGSLNILRHKVTPTFGLSYQPDFTDEFYGYTETVTQENTGTANVRTAKDGRRYIDRFALSPYGGTPTGETLNGTFGLGNTFSGKFIDGKNERKVDLITLQSTASYNFLADSLGWSDINTGFSFPFIKSFSFNGSMTHSIYKLTGNGQRQNELVDWIPILTRFGLNASYSLSEKTFNSQKPTVTDSIRVLENEFEAEEVGVIDPFGQVFADNTVPWKVDVSTSYSFNKFVKPDPISWTSRLRAQVRLTKQWNVSYSASINMDDFELQYQNLNITREMECWLFNFTYSPNPYNRYFLLTIRIKDDLLKDIEYRRTSRNLPVF